jgi:hypothetical protein
VGFTFEARHAGMNAAASAPAVRTSAAPATVAGIGRGDAEQLRLDKLAERGDTGERDGYAGGGIAEDEPDGRGASGAEGEAWLVVRDGGRCFQ